VIKRKTSRLTTGGSSSSISLKHLRMIPLALAFAIFVSHLLVLVTADSDNYFVYPPANPNYSSYAPDVNVWDFRRRGEYNITMGDDVGFRPHSFIAKQQSLSPSSPELTYVAKYRRTDPLYFGLWC
jgi:hypothetical protein